MVNIARKTSTLQYRQSIDCHNCGATNNIEEPWKKLDSEQRRTSAEAGKTRLLLHPSHVDAIIVALAHASTAAKMGRAS